MLQQGLYFQGYFTYSQTLFIIFLQFHVRFKIIIVLEVAKDQESEIERALYGVLCIFLIQNIVGRLCLVNLTSAFSSLHDSI